MQTELETIPEAAVTQYERDGFLLMTGAVSPDLVRRAVARMDEVRMGRYETGVAPSSRVWKPGDNPLKLCKIDNAQLSDRTILELVSHPEIGRRAAQLTGAKMVQVWATQLLYKPPGGEEAGNVGWHQDRQYWPYWEGEVFTAWIALSDVTSDAGPIRFVRGSHRWGEINGGDFFGGDLEKLRGKMTLPAGAAWEEVEGILPPGGMSFHSRLTVHGSGPNRSQGPRRSFALHLRTERSRPIPGVPDHGYASYLDDSVRCPVIYRA